METVRPLDLVIFLGAAQGILLGIYLLFHKSKRKQSNYLLASTFIVLSLRLGLYPFVDLLENSDYRVINRLSLLSLLLVPPLFYWFLSTVARQKSASALSILLHLIPFIYYVFDLLIYPLIIPFCYCYIPTISGIAYGIAALILIRMTYRGSAQLISFALSLLGISSLILITDLLNPPIAIVSDRPATIPYLLISVVFYYLVYQMISGNKAAIIRFATKSFAKEVAQIDQHKVTTIKNLIENEKMYLDADLNIQRLAQASGLTRHEISQAINHGCNRTFNEFINYYRITEAKQKLIDPNFNYLSILGIANASGFKSKSTFNHYFKKLTGVTPSEYQKNTRNQSTFNDNN